MLRAAFFVNHNLARAATCATLRPATMAFSSRNDDQKKGHQSEMEWQRPVKGVDYEADNNEPGYEVPGVFRQHRHEYSAKPTEVNAYRR